MFSMRPSELLRGRLAASPSWPLNISAVLCDLRPRFLAKGRVGRSYRAIARNGRVLLASDLPLQELAGRIARLRLQVWHRALVAGNTPQPYGWLLCIRSEPGPADQPLYHARLTRSLDADADLILDVGGREMLAFMLKTATNK
jgi:hypothetical protein